jgi:hypothetical protein
MTWPFALLWYLLGVVSGTTLMMWVQSARKYHEGLTQDDFPE